MSSGNYLSWFGANDNEPPASNAATPDMRNNHLVLDFDDTTDEEAVFSGFMPHNYSGGGLTVILGWSSADTTVTPHSAVWQVGIERINDDGHDVDADSFSSFKSSGQSQEASVSGEVKYTSINFANGAEMDSLVAGERFRLKVRRDADGTSGDDTLTGDAELHFVAIKET